MTNIIHFNYIALKQFRYTFHPPEELRLQREIGRLRQLREPFGFLQVPHLSRNCQARVIEQLTQEWGLPHPRLLNSRNFVVALHGWKAGLQGLYKYYAERRSLEESRQEAIDFMLDHLGFERLENLPLDEQLKLLRSGNERISWRWVNKEVKKRLVERLAAIAGVPHPRILTADDFKDFILPEIGSTLIGLLDFHRRTQSSPGKAIKILLDDLNVTDFAALSWKEQVACLKARENIHWEIVPLTTQLKLVGILRDKVPVQNGLVCPHLRALENPHFKSIVLEEIGSSLGGLLDFYRRQKPAGYQGATIDHLLDQLGVEKLEALPFEQQCRCIRYSNNFFWKNAPKKTSVRLLDRVKELAGLPHLRYLRTCHLREIIIPELGQSLIGLYHCFRVKKNNNDSQNVIDVILDHYGLPKFTEMPFRLQLQWTRPVGIGGLNKWSRVSPTVITYYLNELTHAAGVGTIEALRQDHFSLRAGGKETGLSGLYGFLSQTWEAPVPGTRMIDWAAQKFGSNLQVQIRSKRQARSASLDNEEKMFLLRLAKIDDPEALDHLVFFCQPLIRSCAGWFMKTHPLSRLSFDELLQIGRIQVGRLARNHDPGLSSFETYVRNTLPWVFLKESYQSAGNIRLSVYFREMINKYQSVANALARELDRQPSDEEVASQLQIPVAQYQTVRLLIVHERSLFAPIGDDDATVIDFIPDQRSPQPDRQLFDQEREHLIREAIAHSSLTPQEQLIVIKHRLEEVTLEEIGHELGDITRERVRQIEVKALQKLISGPYGEKLRKLWVD